MIHELPICFDCETRIERIDEVVFASPLYDNDPTAPTACFHGLCLMRWRDRRAAIVEHLDTLTNVLMAHFRGECPDCQTPESDVG